MLLKNIRILFIINITILLISLCIFSYFDHNRIYPSIGYFLKTPPRYDGKINEYFGSTSNQTKGHFYLNSGDNKIKVLYENADRLRNTKFGPTSVKGVLKKEGHIELISIHRHDYNYIKYILSFFGLIFLTYILLKEWSITKKGFIDKKCLIG